MYIYKHFRYSSMTFIFYYLLLTILEISFSFLTWSMIKLKNNSQIKINNIGKLKHLRLCIFS